MSTTTSHHPNRFSPALLILPALCILLGGGLGYSRAITACDTIHVTDGVRQETCDHALALECDDHTERAFADIDGDGSVDAYDIALLLTDMGRNGTLAADINDDGIVDSEDLTALIRQLNS